MNVSATPRPARPTAGADAGKVEFFFGSSAGATTDILVDVVGYLTTTGIADLTARLAALEAAKPIVASDHRDATNTIAANTVTMVNSVTLTVPVAGTISIVGSAYFYGAVGSYKCNLAQGAGITYSADLSDTDRPLWIVTGAVNISCSTNGAISVTPGAYVINLVVTVPASSGVDDSSLEATFIAGGSVTVRPNAVSVEPPAGPGSEQG